jgi:hypothetical protein
VRSGSAQSATLTTNTGAPQGYVFSPILFTPYTNDLRSTRSNCDIMKYADDTAIVARLSVRSPICTRSYMECIDMFMKWCNDHFLIINATKTKEMIFDFGKRPKCVTPVIMDNQNIDAVNEYKYLGTIVDNKLNWKSNCKRIYLRKLNDFNVDSSIMNMFYKSVIESIITFSIVVYHGNSHKTHQYYKTSVKNNKNIMYAYISAANIIPKPKLSEMTLITLYTYTTQILPHSHKSNVAQNRYLTSFIRTSIRMLNSDCHR